MKSPPQHLASVVVVLGLSSLVLADDAPALPGYHHYVIGNAADVIWPARGLLVLQGGGDDVDENYVRMGELGGGDFVVLRASGDDEYNEYIYALCHCDSVATIVFDNRQAAFEPFVVETIRNAEALFIAARRRLRAASSCTRS